MVYSKTPVLEIAQYSINTLRPRHNGRHFPDDIFKWIFLNENMWISIKLSLKFVPRGSINNIPALVQIMAWRRPGDKPLSEPMMIILLTHICVTRPQWVKPYWWLSKKTVVTTLLTHWSYHGLVLSHWYTVRCRYNTINFLQNFHKQ